MIPTVEKINCPRCDAAGDNEKLSSSSVSLFPSAVGIRNTVEMQLCFISEIDFEFVLPYVLVCLSPDFSSVQLCIQIYIPFCLYELIWIYLSKDQQLLQPGGPELRPQDAQKL